MDEHRRSLRHLIEMIFVRGLIGPSASRHIRLERKDDALVLRATNAPWWFGALFGGFFVFWLLGWIRQETGGGLSYWSGVVMGVAFVLVGLFLFLPREVNTIFDLRSRRVLRNVTFCKGLYERRHVYSFDEIAGLGVKEYGANGSEGYSYIPVMVLRGGKTRWLAANNGGYLAWANTIDDVCRYQSGPRYARLVGSPRQACGPRRARNSPTPLSDAILPTAPVISLTVASDATAQLCARAEGRSLPL